MDVDRELGPVARRQVAVAARAGSSGRRAACSAAPSGPTAPCRARVRAARGSRARAHVAEHGAAERAGALGGDRAAAAVDQRQPRARLARRSPGPARRSRARARPLRPRPRRGERERCEQRDQRESPVHAPTLTCGARTSAVFSDSGQRWSSQQDIALVRSFNRLVTRQVGALNDRYLGPAPARRVARAVRDRAEGATPRDVRARLGLDSGYLSRMIRSLQRDGLVEKRPNPADRRTTRLCLTRAGRAEMRELDRISDELAASALAPLTDEQRARLLRAQAEVRHLLAISMVTIAPEDPVLGRRTLVPGALLRGAGRALRGALRSGADAARRRQGPDPAGGGVPARPPQRTAGGMRRAEDAEPGRRRDHADVGRPRPPRARDRRRASSTRSRSRRPRSATTRVRLYTNRSLAEAKAMYRAQRLRGDRPLQRRPVRAPLVREATQGLGQKS